MHITPGRLRALLALSILAWGGLAAAQPAGLAEAAQATVIDLPTALRLALEQPGARAAAHEVAAAEAEASQAGRLPNPELDYQREGRQAGWRTTTILIRQPLELGGKRQARIDLAEGASALARGELALRRGELRAGVRAAFYALLLAQEKQQLAEAGAALARRSVEIAARRVQAGKISPLDETRARLAAVDAASESTRAGAELLIARTRLGALVGQAGTPALTAAGDPAALPLLKPLAALLPGAGNTGVGNMGAVRQARLRLAAQEAQTEVERAARIPDLTLSAGRQREEEGPQARGRTVIGLSVPLPLFDRNQDRLLASLRRADKARDELAAAEVDTAVRIAETHTRYELASAEARLLAADVIPSAQSAHALTLTGFEYGKFSFLDVLDAQRTLFQVRSRRSDALLAAWQAWADIERLAGPGASTATKIR
jgi:cobalt-zinc-cadmium efflux system outer membrane protein